MPSRFRSMVSTGMKCRETSISTPRQGKRGLSSITTAVARLDVSWHGHERQRVDVLGPSRRSRHKHQRHHEEQPTESHPESFSPAFKSEPQRTQRYTKDGLHREITINSCDFRMSLCA